MARSMWTGSIAFGLVNIPIKLYSAISPKDVHFHQLHDKDGVRIQQKRVCPADGEEVAWEHVVKGYEVRKGQYVTVEPEELRALDPEKTQTIDIEAFVPLEEIDPIYYESAYYLAPDRGAGKAYALLVEAMTRSRKVAIARFVLRTKQYMGVLRPIGKTLAIETLYYADEVNAPGEVEGLPSAIKLHEKELEMAEQLVDSLAGEFTPTEYHDEYRARVLELIEKKAEGEVVTPPHVEKKAQVMDLMAALKASLGGMEGGRKGPRRTRDRAEAPVEKATPRAHARTTRSRSRSHRKSA